MSNCGQPRDIRKTVAGVKADWADGYLTRKQIANKFAITREQFFAIVVAGKDLTTEEMAPSLPKVRPGMKAAEIRRVLNPQEGRK